MGNLQAGSIMGRILQIVVDFIRIFNIHDNCIGEY